MSSSDSFDKPGVNRRDFLKDASLATGGLMLASLMLSEIGLIVATVILLPVKWKNQRVLPVL
jgi:hypothetical protein